MNPVASIDPVTQATGGSTWTDLPGSDKEVQLQNDPATFRDLLIFEERLRSNVNRMRRRQQKYEAFLGLLVVINAYFFYSVFVKPSEHKYLDFTNRVLFLLFVTILFLFFATGMYREKIVLASKFLPQTNRTLRSFNIHFNRESVGHLTFHKKIPQSFQDGFQNYRDHYKRRRSRAMTATKTTLWPGSSTPDRKAAGTPTVKKRQSTETKLRKSASLSLAPRGEDADDRRVFKAKSVSGLRTVTP